VDKAILCLSRFTFLIAIVTVVKILVLNITKPNVTREKLAKSCQKAAKKAAKKLPKRLTYEKGVRKTLMKLTPVLAGFVRLQLDLLHMQNARESYRFHQARQIDNFLLERLKRY